MKLVGDSWNPTYAPSSNVSKKLPIKSSAQSIASNNLVGQKRQEIKARKNSLPKPKELDKLSSVASKLAKVEADSKAQIAEIGEKSKQLRNAQDELDSLKLVKSDKDEMEYKKILNKKSELEKENKEMKEFLEKNGFKWVGNEKIEPKSNLNEFNKELDLEVVAKKIEKLNVAFEKESKYSIGKDGAHRLTV